MKGGRKNSKIMKGKRGGGGNFFLKIDVPAPDDDVDEPMPPARVAPR